MLLGHARGKVGSLVFSRSNGKQIVRARAEVVNNPQTMAQMIQRIILNTASQAYSKMLSIVDHSFEGVQTGQKSMSYFMKRNIDALRARVANITVESGMLYDVYAFTPIGQNVLAPNGYEISKGSLPQVAAYELEGDNTVAAMALSVNTYQGVIDQYGLQRGDQLTFVTMQQDPTSHVISFHYARIILDPMQGDAQADMASPFIVDGHVNLPNVRNEGEFSNLRWDTDHVEFGFTLGYLAATGIIVSRKNTNGTWLRSNCAMVASSVNRGQAVSMGEALELFSQGSISTTSNRYLNNSGTGAVANIGVAGAGFNAQTVSGVSVPVMSITTKDGYSVIVDPDESKYYIISKDSNSANFNKYLKPDTSLAPAPADATDANTVVLGSMIGTSDTQTAAQASNLAWFISQGFTMPVLYGIEQG